MTNMTIISKVIVFGATGAIGTSLIEILSEKQPTWEIVAISRSGASSNSPLAKMQLQRVMVIKGDVEDKQRRSARLLYGRVSVRTPVLERTLAACSRQSSG